jgi:hypothetical protein
LPAGVSAPDSPEAKHAAPHLGYKTRVITLAAGPACSSISCTRTGSSTSKSSALSETTINNPLDLQRTKGLDTLPHLRTIGRQINAKLLDIKRVADGAIVNGRLDVGQ